MRKIIVGLLIAGLYLFVASQAWAVSRIQGPSGGGVSSLSDLGDICDGNEILQRNAGDTAWECSATGAGGTIDDDVTVNGVAVDTTANFVDGDIDWTLADGGLGGPDDVTGTLDATYEASLDVATATALAANPAAATAGSCITDIAANGDVEAEVDVWTEAENTAAGYISAETDDQTIDVFSVSGNNVQLSLEDDGEATKTVDISSTTAVTANSAKVTNATHSGDVTGATALTIAADKVLESHLKAVDAAADEECLTYESTTGDFEWQACGGGGAPEGTAVLSTGEGGGTKFLREDGDGTSSWQTVAGGSGATTDGGAVTYVTSATDDFAIGGTTSAAPFFFDEADETLTVGTSGAGNIDLGTNTVTDAILGNLLKGSIDLPVQSAKLTGSFVTDGTPAQGAAIDAGDGNWRLLFDPTTSESGVWQFRMPNDYSSNLVAKIQYSMSTTDATETVGMEVAIMATADGEAVDVGTASFDTENVITGGTSSPDTAGYIDEISISFTNDDSVAAGEFVAIKLYRDPADDDTHTGDLELIAFQLEYDR